MAIGSSNEPRVEPWRLVRSKIKREMHRAVGFEWPTAYQLPDPPPDFEPPRISSRGLHITLLARHEGPGFVVWTSCWVAGIDQAVCIELVFLKPGLVRLSGRLLYQDHKSLQDFEWLELCLPVSMDRGYYVGLRETLNLQWTPRGLTIHGVSCEINGPEHQPRMPGLETTVNQRVNSGTDDEGKLRLLAVRPSHQTVTERLDGIELSFKDDLQPQASYQQRASWALLLRSGPMAQQALRLYVLVGYGDEGTLWCCIENALQESDDALETAFNLYYHTSAFGSRLPVNGPLQDRVYMRIGSIFISAVVRRVGHRVCLDMSATSTSAEEIPGVTGKV